MIVRFSISLVQAATHGDAGLAADAEFLGAALEVAVLTKSLLLLSVSVSPALTLTITWVPEGAVLDVPSGQLPVLFEHPSHHFFAFAEGVNFSVIKKVDAMVVGDAHEFIGGFVVDLFAEADPTAEGEGADLEA